MTIFYKHKIITLSPCIRKKPVCTFSRVYAMRACVARSTLACGAGEAAAANCVRNVQSTGDGDVCAVNNLCLC